MALEVILYFISLTIAFFLTKVLVAFLLGFTSTKEITSISYITFTMFPIFLIVYPILVECSNKSDFLFGLTPFILPIIYFIIDIFLLQKATERDLYDVNSVCIGMNLFGFVAICILLDFKILIPISFKYNSLIDPQVDLASIAMMMFCISFTSYMLLVKIFRNNKSENEIIDDVKCSIPKEWVKDAYNNFEVLSTISMKSKSFEAIRELIIQIVLLENERLNIRNEIIELKSNIDKIINSDIINRFIYKILDNEHTKSKHDFIIKNRKLVSELDEKICSKYEKLINSFPEEVSEYQNKLKTK